MDGWQSKIFGYWVDKGDEPDLISLTYDELSADIKNFFIKSIEKFGDGAGNFDNHILNKHMFEYIEDEVIDFKTYAEIKLKNMDKLINNSIKDQDEEMMPNDKNNL